ncbi:uncharacterized protein ASCRUDRAFT_79691 [Ascoidea rubescens DSM 1968]|uniref:Uncharacterized protein n=1 Tax=Ascoidea rubescens DSM 1968 TaxID=1344418 RepID=A0A1D2VND8_9ASCO|nr:hypothetical protein ASCRUDRAFT_79691 [Ascoidea rubescens DSM 1968]ODV63141.1 hypothetical protein ASCRUDRAFT_79691 [Ascoidea rubescens DSM 1968]
MFLVFLVKNFGSIYFLQDNNLNQWSFLSINLSAISGFTQNQKSNCFPDFKSNEMV